MVPLRESGRDLGPILGDAGCVEIGEWCGAFMGKNLGRLRRGRGGGVGWRGSCTDPGSPSTPPGPKDFDIVSFSKGGGRWVGKTGRKEN